MSPPSSDAVSRTWLTAGSTLDVDDLRQTARKVALADELAVGENARALDDVAQLPDVPVPRSRDEHALGRRRQSDDLLPETRGRLPDERCREIRNVLTPLAQGGHAQLHHIQPVEQIAPEPAGGGLAAQIAVGRRNDVHVDVRWRDRAHPLDFAGFEHAQQFGLHGLRQLADLVKEERSAVRDFEQSRLVVGRSGECAARVPEQLALEERLDHRRAVDRDEPLAAPWARTCAARAQRALFRFRFRL